MKAYIVILLVLIAQCLAQEDTCPQIDISPCTCRTYFNGACIVTCTLSSQNAVDKIADIPNLCNGHVHFVLVHSKVSGIPVRLWKTLLSSKTVDINIKHAKLEGLVPPGNEDLGEVSTPGSAVIKVDHAKVGEWDWKLLSKFSAKKELTIVVDDSTLPEISPEFSQIARGQVTKLTIDSNGLAELPDEIFANFKDLSSLSLQNNRISSVSRSMLPTPANKLHYLALNGNMLTTLPGDLFSEMPALEVIYLRENRLKSIPQELIQSISSNKLRRLDFVRNPWECDCQLEWIVKNVKFHINFGKCRSPDALAGKNVRDIPKLLGC